MNHTKAGRLLVVVVNFRTAGLTIDCLHSLSTEVAGTDGVRVVVVDNASGDQSVARLRDTVESQGWGHWVQLQALEENGGFAAGNNAAIRAARGAGMLPPYVLLLNPDTIVRPGALAGLLAFMDAHPHVGIAGSRLEQPDGTPHYSAFRFPTVLGELEGGLRLRLATRLLATRTVAAPPRDHACQVDWVSGASLLVRSAVFDDVGLLDERYFLYFEEVDFCLRSRLAGWPCWYVPESRVVHLVGQSSGLGGAHRRRMPTYWFESRRQYFLTHHGVFKTFLANFVWASAFATFRVRRVLQRKPDVDPTGLLWDFFKFNFLRSAR